MVILKSPFVHFIKENFLEAKLFSELKNSIEHLQWEEAKSEEYLKDNSTFQSTEYVISHVAKNSFSFFLSDSWIGTLNQYFNLGLRQCTTAVFLKMNKGFFNFVHSDENSFGELVRLILYISDSNEYDGGELVLHNNDSEKSIYSEIKFRSNTIFGFRMSANSFHSVNEITRGCRICLSLTYS